MKGSSWFWSGWVKESSVRTTRHTVRLTLFAETSDVRHRIRVGPVSCVLSIIFWSIKNQSPMLDNGQCDWHKAGERHLLKNPFSWMSPEREREREMLFRFCVINDRLIHSVNAFPIDMPLAPPSERNVSSSVTWWGKQKWRQQFSWIVMSQWRHVWRHLVRTTAKHVGLSSFGTRNQSNCHYHEVNPLPKPSFVINTESPWAHRMRTHLAILDKIVTQLRRL